MYVVPESSNTSTDGFGGPAVSGVFESFPDDLEGASR
jgi:hypothetical protein